MGRHFIIENSGASRIFKESPLQCLEALGLHVSKLDQCMYGAEQEQVRIRKSSMFVSDFPQTGLDTRCDKNHEHQHIRGQEPEGSRTAAAARYPTELCDSILDSITASTRSTQQDRGRNPPLAHTFVTPEGFGDMSKRDQVTCRLQELRAVAQKLGYEDTFRSLVEPWLSDDSSSPLCSRVGQPSDSLGDKQQDRATTEQKAFESSCDVASMNNLTNTLDKMNNTLMHLMQETSRPVPKIRGPNRTLFLRFTL